eukprot:4784105-Prymnesium_polylepis.1
MLMTDTPRAVARNSGRVCGERDRATERMHFGMTYVSCNHGRSAAQSGHTGPAARGTAGQEPNAENRNRDAREPGAPTK